MAIQGDVHPWFKHKNSTPVSDIHKREQYNSSRLLEDASSRAVPPSSRYLSISQNQVESSPCGADPGTKAIAEAMMAKIVTIWTVFMLDGVATARCEENTHAFDSVRGDDRLQIFLLNFRVWHDLFVSQVGCGMRLGINLNTESLVATSTVEQNDEEVAEIGDYIDSL